MSKREVNPLLKSILEVDKQVTTIFVNWINNIPNLSKLRRYDKFIEKSCNGVACCAVWLILMWFLNNPTLVPMQINMFLGLISDILIVATLKAVARRRRPESKPENKLKCEDYDKFSFPSGHSSRTAYIAYFFTKIYPVNPLVQLVVVGWCAAVSLVRLVTRRHHLLDILGGIALGCLNAMLIGLIWINDDTCKAIFYASLGSEPVELA